MAGRPKMNEKISWLALWDTLYIKISEKISWDKNELMALMTSLEKDAIRVLETKVKKSEILGE